MTSSPVAQPPDPQAVEVEQLALQIIAHAGNGRAKVFAAARAYGAGDVDGYARLLASAADDFLLAHQAQTAFLQQAVAAAAGPTNILLIHAMDILMSATSEKELVTVLVGAFEARQTR